MLKNLETSYTIGVIPHMGSDTGQGLIPCRFPLVSTRFPFPCLG
jgi:hypothetical protein